MTKGHIETPLARGLPRPLAERLGRIVVRSTHVEYYLLLATKRLLRISIAHARDLFSDGTWEVRFARLQRLAESKQFPIVVPAGFVTTLKEAESRRNLLVHSSWRQDKQKFTVHKARGRYARNPVEIVVDVAYLNETTQKLDECIAALLGIKAQTDQLISGP